jgi:hypothetical protein
LKLEISDLKGEADKAPASWIPSGKPIDLNANSIKSNSTELRWNFCWRSRFGVSAARTSQSLNSNQPRKISALDLPEKTSKLRAVL